MYLGVFLSAYLLRVSCKSSEVGEAMRNDPRVSRTGGAFPNRERWFTRAVHLYFTTGEP